MLLFDLLLSFLNSTAGFIYPTYATYKCLSRRPSSEQELERWLMYWSVVGCIIAVEHVAEWAIRWVPFYGFVKTVFLLWLAIPQTQGATYIYQAHLAPFLTRYQPTIDSHLSQYKKKLYKHLQTQFRLLWKHISALIAENTGINLNNVDPAASPLTEAVQGLAGSGRATDTAGRPTSAADLDLSQGARVALGLWKTWGPTVVNALRPIQDGMPTFPTAGDRSADTTPSSTSGFAVTSSILARRRQLEAELAALDALHPTSGSSPNIPTIPTPSTGSGSDHENEHPSHSESSENLEQSQYLTEADARTVRDGRFEEIERDESESGEEGDRDDQEMPNPASPSATGWWPAWSRKSGVYEHVKAE
ncbi:hypothetical protein FRB96_004278 [Tulasnella sp. 330]|nr:hypothetical protein FRB96_004278 [Tulasnella sp. 330]KAG8877913.1 hypothetical protein FRB97_002911 [Tulasnella sp. 331]